MDDDGYADHDWLEKLVNYSNEDYSCISSIVVNQNNKFNLVFPMPLLKKIIYQKFYPFLEKYITLISYSKLIYKIIYMIFVIYLMVHYYLLKN